MGFLSIILSILEPEIHLANPKNTPFGIVVTDNYCNSIYLVSNGEIKELYTAPGCGRLYTLSHDRKLLGIKIIDKNGLQIPAIYDLETENIERLSEPTYQVGQVSFSNDGKIAYTIGEELIVKKNGEISRFNLDYYVNLCPISPDGNFVVFNDNYDQLWIMDLNNSKKVCITDRENGYWSPKWSNDSRFIAYSTLSGFIKVYDRLKNTTYEIGNGQCFNWSEENGYLIYYSTKTNGRELISSEIYLAKYDGSEKFQITDTPEIFEMDPDFVDQKTIIYHTYNRNEIWMGRLKDNKLEETKMLFKSKKPLKINHYKIDTDFGTKDSINVPYVHQVYDTPDWHNGNWSCAPTTAIMTIAYYRKLPYWDSWCSYPYGHTSHFGNYICSRYNYWEVTYTDTARDPSNNLAWGGYGYMWYDGYSPYTRMYYYLINHNLNSWIDNTPTWEETIAEIQAGWPYCMCVGLTSAGHLVLAVGQVLNWHTLIFNDPYGNKNTPGYPSYDGKYARYDWPGYNNGYQNLNSVYWCRGARGDLPPPVDTLVDDLQIRYPEESYGFYMNTNSPSDMRYYRDNIGGYNGHFWWTYTTTSTDTCYVTWTPNLPAANYYTVYAYIPSINATALARYKIYYAGGNETVVINQNNYSNQWVPLGTFYFNQTGGFVYLGDATGTQGQKIAFDAMVWRQMSMIEERKSNNVITLNIVPVTRDKILINSNYQNEILKVSIYNYLGQLVKNTQQRISNDGSLIIDVQEFSSGIYFLRIEDREREYLFKTILVK